MRLTGPSELVPDRFLYQSRDSTAEAMSRAQSAELRPVSRFPCHAARMTRTLRRRKTAVHTPGGPRIRSLLSRGDGRVEQDANSSAAIRSRYADRMTAPAIRTVTVPDRDLLEALQPLPEGINLALWDFETAPVGADLEDIDVAVLPYMSRGDYSEQLQSAPALKLVQTQSTGYEGVPEMAGEGVAVCSAAGVHAAATAEMAVGLAISSLRGIDVAVRNQREGVWSPGRFPGLADRRVLLLGVGGIGEEIARRLDAFEVELTRVGSSARSDARGQVHSSEDLVELAAGHDVLIIITPLLDSTRGLVGRKVLAALPDGALVVNVARGAVVDSDALTEEVVNGRLRAALDVFDPEPIPAGHPLWAAENAIITPHNGGNTGAFWPRIVRLLRRQLEALAAGQEPANLVVPGPWGSDRAAG